MKRKFLYLSVLFALVAFIFNACQQSYTPDQATGEDNSQADNVVVDVIFMAHDNTDGGKALVSLDTTCRSINIDTLGNGQFLTTIEFDNCDMFGDGVVRNGKIIIQWQVGWLLDSSKTTVITFDDFKRNDIELEGTININFSRQLSVGQGITQIFNIVEKDMKITYADGKNTTWNSNRTVKWISGFNTPRIRKDNVFEVSYTRNGINKNGEGYTATATDLHFDASCQYHLPLSGTLTVTKEDGSQFTIDFGNGECDNCVIYKQDESQVQVCKD